MNRQLDDVVPGAGRPTDQEGGSARTERDDFEAALARATLDALHFRLCVLDGEGRIVATNRAWREFGADGPAGAPPAGEAPHRPWAQRCWSPQTAAAVEGAMAALTAEPREAFVLEYECHTLSTDGRWFELRLQRLPGQDPLRLLMTIEDITARRQALQAQQRSAERLKQLGAHLESVSEEQRAMLARELHDELGAALTMLKLDLATVAIQVQGAPPLRNRLDGLQGQVQAALQIVKRISSDLRPATLDVLGLMATLRWYVDQFSRSTGIATTLHLPDAVHLSDVADIAVFRIVQEGLTNVALHAQATRVRVEMRQLGGELVLDIIDNGRGVTEGELQRYGSLGVIGMRERADYLGGTLSIHGAPGDGTQLTLRIPLDG